MENLIGKQFGMLKVVKFSHKEKTAKVIINITGCANVSAETL